MTTSDVTTTEMAAIAIRPLDVDDVGDVLKLGQRVYDLTVKPYTSWSLTAVATHLDGEGASCWVARAADGRLAGFVLGSVGFDQRRDWGNLEWIATDPAFRGQGIAARLVTACCRGLETAGVRAVVTDVESRNEASAGLMRRSGFEAGATVTLFVREVADIAPGG
ncbi:GNAT family N-acetyltransferase [Streptomyces sp. NPDC088785]|uniref:GNAT family N-acetyltransferase n=1 Tax=Streptomyces sp. NPDC088785 TaxID=3365897 RepID=UPI003829172A